MDLKCLHGDITTLPEDNTHDTIICQQVNCMGVMGAGLAAQIRRKWPNVYTEYRKRCTKDMLGTYHMVKVEPHLYVANIFGQLSYGTEKCQTNYVALACAIDVNDFRGYAAYMMYPDPVAVVMSDKLNDMVTSAINDGKITLREAFDKLAKRDRYGRIDYEYSDGTDGYMPGRELLCFCDEDTAAEHLTNTKKE